MSKIFTLRSGILAMSLLAIPGFAAAADQAPDSPQAGKMAQMAHDGFARAINPVHTMSDGDTIFALATGASGRTASVTLLGALGADVMATAIVRAVRAASRLDLPGLPLLPAAGESWATTTTRAGDPA